MTEFSSASSAPTSSSFVENDPSNGWLVMANCVSLAIALYGIARLDLPAMISRHNAEHSREMTGQGFPLDMDYFEHLGPGTIPSIDELLGSPSFTDPNERERFELGRARLALIGFPNDQMRRDLVPLDWQSWTWRQERLRRYIAEHPFAPAPAARHN